MQVESGVTTYVTQKSVPKNVSGRELCIFFSRNLGFGRVRRTDWVVWVVVAYFYVSYL
jgi:hypothetical protein